MCPFFLIVSTARNLKLNKTASKWLLACSRLSDSGQKAKEKSTRKSWRAGKGKGRAPAQALPSFLPFNFRVCAFSIQRTRRSRSMELAKCRSKHTVKHTTQTQVQSILLRVFLGRILFIFIHPLIKFRFKRTPTMESGLPVESLAQAILSLSCVYLLFHPTATFPPSVLLLKRSKAGILVLKK